MTRGDILLESKKTICSDRNEQYGDPGDNFEVIAGLWEEYILHRCVSYGADVTLNASDVGMMMVLFKVGRHITSDKPKVDTFVDICGYAACSGEIDTEPADDTIIISRSCGFKNEDQTH